jgi:hypothetical protein
MISVYIDGVLQIPGIDYTAAKNAVSFSQPPMRGSYIEVSALSTVVRLLGDGSTYLFMLDIDVERHTDLNDMLHDAFKLRDVPAVAEALERLKVVIELVKQ